MCRPHLALAKFGWGSLFDLPFVDQRGVVDCLDRGSVPVILCNKHLALEFTISVHARQLSQLAFFGGYDRTEICFSKCTSLDIARASCRRDGHRVLPVVSAFAHRYPGLGSVL